MAAMVRGCVSFPLHLTYNDRKYLIDISHCVHQLLWKNGHFALYLGAWGLDIYMSGILISWATTSKGDGVYVSKAGVDKEAYLL